MKKAAIIFAILFAATLLIPMISIVQSNKSSSQSELVTIFSSSITLESNYHSLSQAQNER